MLSSVHNPRLFLLQCRFHLHFPLKSPQFHNSVVVRASQMVSESQPQVSTTLPTSEILSIRKSLLSRQRRAVEIVQDYFNRLRQIEPQIRSFLHVSDNAMKEAEAIDRKIERNEELGPLAGALMGVKDNICTVDMPSTSGSRILEDYQPAYDATAVKKLRDSGAVIVWKTNMDEFGMGSTTESSGFQKFHRDLPATRVFAYGTSKRAATVPGPTIEALHGIETFVTWRNHLPSQHILPWDPTIPTATPLNKGVPTVVHLHGAIGEPESDGNSKSWFTAGFKDTGPTWTKKKYRYHNHQQPGNLWYHDHAMGLTRVNLLAGLIGAYIIRHPQVENPLGLPRANDFDRPLVVFDRSFRSDGSLYMNSTGNNPSIHPQWQPEYFGNVIIVNGKAWPRMTVRRRKYRFRIINASNARFFRFFLTNGMRFIHVGSDSVYLARPVTVEKLLLGPSEIADVVFDFSNSTSDSVILANDAPFPYPSGDPTDEINGKVMKFVIKRHRVVDPWRIPAELVKYPAPDVSSASTTRHIAMYEYTSSIDEPTHLYINGKSYDEPATETPKAGSTEIWNVINLTEDNHPLHIHLGLFVALDQTELVDVDGFRNCMMKKNDAAECQINKYARGRQIAVPTHERGWKNVFKMRPGCLTRILVRFSYIHSNVSYPFDATAEPGYVYHCHILDHEDNVMMRPLKIIA